MTSSSVIRHRRAKGTSVLPAHPGAGSADGVMTPYEDTCQRVSADGKAIREVLDRVGDKWSLLIIATLQGGLLRFSELQKHVPGISQRMLTLTLRNLERDGLVTRTVHARVPPRVDYELTTVGRTLIGPSAALALWAVDNQAYIEQSRRHYDGA